MGAQTWRYLHSLSKASSDVMTVHEPGDVLSKMAENVCEAVSAKAAAWSYLTRMAGSDVWQRRGLYSTQHSSILVGTDSMVSE